MNISKEKQREIAIILQTEQYKGVRVDEELIVQIMGELEDSFKEVSEIVDKTNKIFPMGTGTYMYPPNTDLEIERREIQR